MKACCDRVYMHKMVKGCTVQSVPELQINVFFRCHFLSQVLHFTDLSLCCDSPGMLLLCNSRKFKKFSIAFSFFLFLTDERDEQTF